MNLKIYRNQWIVCLTVSLATFTSGLAIGWASPYLAQLKSNNSGYPFQLTDSETSWVASLMFLGRAVGSLTSAAVQLLIGRKKTLLCSSGVSILGWLCIILARTVTWLYVSRTFCGFATGLMWPPVSLFLSEVADPKIRGSLLSFNINMAIFGLFVGNVIGPYIQMNCFAYFALLPNILFLLLFSMVIPDSPHQYFNNNKLLEAEKSLQWFLRKSNVTNELNEMEEYSKKAKLTLFKRLSDFKNRDHLRNLGVLFGLNLCTFVSGNNAINAYMEIIVKQLEISLSSSVTVIILSFCMISAGFTSTFFIDIVGRRRLYCYSSIGVAISLFLMGLNYYFISIDFRPANISWFAFFSLFSYFVAYNSGSLAIPTTLSGEMFPPSIKVFTTTMFSTSLALFAFLATFSFTPFNNLVGSSVAFWIRGLFILASAPITYLLIKETKGKSLLQIQKSVTSAAIPK